MSAEMTPTVEALVAAAVLAPSSHNSQPWKFRYDSESIQVYADRTRGLPVNDPFDRELTISCGAALFNLRIAAEAAGYTPDVERLPVSENADLLATVTLHPSGASNQVELADAIPLRRTHRGPFTTDAVSPEIVAALDHAAAEHGVELRWVPPGEQREQVARLVGEGDKGQFTDRSWRRELASWMHARRRGDGLTVPALAGPIIRFAVTRFDLGIATARKDAVVTRNAPLVGVLMTDGDETADWLTAGEALEHVLLIAAVAGIHGGYSNQPFQLARLRPELRELLSLTGHPQIVIRLGTPADMPSTSPRRPIHDTIISPHPTSRSPNRTLVMTRHTSPA